MSKFYNCGCYYSRNIFIKKYNTHFTYHDSQQFHQEYNKILPSLGCDTELKKTLLEQEINKEVDRRKNLESEAFCRKELLQKLYKPLDPSVYKLQDCYLDPKFKLLVNSCRNSTKKQISPFLDIISEEKQLYGFPIFAEEFCCLILKELDHYAESDLPKGKPNSMNKYGVLIDEIGFQENFSNVLRTKYLDPLSALLFPEWRGERLDSHKIFSVSYKMGQDLDLDYHYDNSEVTLNICLGKSFKGSELYFGDTKAVPIFDSSCVMVPHKVGYGIFHRGQQLHGALPLISGERHNLIIWLRSSSVRNKKCPMCNLKPALLVPSNGYGDGFTDSTVQVCNVL
ncbi:hypothetical protein JTE90_013075 [Oedothorax gibbosus]|uniref:Fe2OG dioxygenase domain-containing protein n=1 Tax=Oedothorax gibbosus TaxID=931172 RepID=A0AAV6UKN3_9ARAC|nr:hypothetical protein JTE90_013075 [Oedothorax gibbosus]